MMNPMRNIALRISDRHVEALLDDPSEYNRDTELRVYAMIETQKIVEKMGAERFVTNLPNMLLYETILGLERIKDAFATLNL